MFTGCWFLASHLLIYKWNYYEFWNNTDQLFEEKITYSLSFFHSLSEKIFSTQRSSSQVMVAVLVLPWKRHEMEDKEEESCAPQSQNWFVYPYFCWGMGEDVNRSPIVMNQSHLNFSSPSFKRIFDCRSWIRREDESQDVKEGEKWMSHFLLHFNFQDFVSHSFGIFWNTDWLVCLRRLIITIKDGKKWNEQNSGERRKGGGDDVKSHSAVIKSKVERREQNEKCLERME